MAKLSVQIDDKLLERMLKYIWEKFGVKYERKKSLVVSMALDKFLREEGY